MNTEEAFLLSSLKEFVKIWGSGNQATLNIECKDGKACVRMETLLGHPSSSHFKPCSFKGSLGKRAVDRFVEIKPEQLHFTPNVHKTSSSIRKNQTLQ